MKAYIKAISHYLPEKILSNDILSAEFPEWSVEKISDKTGIFERKIAADNEYSSDMAIKAANILFIENNIDRNDIDFIILCTQSPDYFLPTTACIVQDKLSIPTSAGAFDFNLGCSGYIYGLAIAKGLIAGNIAKNILLITSETYSKFIHPQDKSNRTIFGDAASATLISSDGFAEIGEFDLGTDGKGEENLIVKRGGLRYPKTGDNETVSFDEYGNAKNENFLFMNGTAIFNFTSQKVPILVNNTLTKNNLIMSNIDLFIFHQANRFMLNHLRKKLSIPEERFYLFLKTCGNTVSSTIPIALEEAYKTKNINPGNKILLSGFGVGYSWGGTVLYF